MDVDEPTQPVLYNSTTNRGIRRTPRPRKEGRVSRRNRNILPDISTKLFHLCDDVFLNIGRRLDMVSIKRLEMTQNAVGPMAIRIHRLKSLVGTLIFPASPKHPSLEEFGAYTAASCLVLEACVDFDVVSRLAANIVRLEMPVDPAFFGNLSRLLNLRHLLVKDVSLDKSHLTLLAESAPSLQSLRLECISVAGALDFCGFTTLETLMIVPKSFSSLYIQSLSPCLKHLYILSGANFRSSARRVLGAPLFVKLVPTTVETLVISYPYIFGIDPSYGHPNAWATSHPNLSHLIMGIDGNEWLKDVNGKWQNFLEFLSDEKQDTLPVPFMITRLPSLDAKFYCNLMLVVHRCFYSNRICLAIDLLRTARLTLNNYDQQMYEVGLDMLAQISCRDAIASNFVTCHWLGYFLIVFYCPSATNRKRLSFCSTYLENLLGKICPVNGRLIKQRIMTVAYICGALTEPERKKRDGASIVSIIKTHGFAVSAFLQNTSAKARRSVRRILDNIDTIPTTAYVHTLLDSLNDGKLNSAAAMLPFMKPW